MKIKLQDGYEIEDDGIGFTLKQTTRKMVMKKETQTEVEEDVAVVICYPANLTSALKAYARHACMDYEGDLAGYVERYENVLVDHKKLF